MFKKKICGGGYESTSLLQNPYEGRLQDVVSQMKGGVNL